MQIIPEASPHARECAREVPDTIGKLLANLSGLHIELGILGEKVKNREITGTSLRIFPELGAAFFDPDEDRVIFTEHGKRTTYSLDWEGWGVKISPWSDYRTLRQMMVSRLRTG